MERDKQTNDLIKKYFKRIMFNNDKREYVLNRLRNINNPLYEECLEILKNAAAAESMQHQFSAEDAYFNSLTDAEFEKLLEEKIAARKSNGGYRKLKNKTKKQRKQRKQRKHKSRKIVRK